MSFLNQNKFEAHAALLHLLIKSVVDTVELNRFLNQISAYMNSLDVGKLFWVRNTRSAYSSIDKMAKNIIGADHNGKMVYSCLSISILIHIYLCALDIESEIIIGSCILDNKVYSHAWVKTYDNHLFDYRYDNYKYRVIKRINLLRNT